MSAHEVDTVIVFLAENPTAGSEIRGTGGCRKFRVAGRGKGKSGGYRMITFYSGSTMPVFLLTVFSKGERSDLSQDERNALLTSTRAIAAEYERRVIKVGT